MSGELLRIVPPDLQGDGPHRTQGTKLFVGEQELTGVVRVEIVAEVNDVWKANVECMVHPPYDLTAWAVVHYPTLWQRFRQWVKRAF